MLLIKSVCDVIVVFPNMNCFEVWL